MRKQQTLLFTMLGYLSGIFIGILVHNNHVLFILMAIPTGYVLWRGVKQEEKFRKAMDEVIEKFRAEQKQKIDVQKTKAD